MSKEENKTNKVLVVGGNQQVTTMFKDNGFDTTINVDEPNVDLVVFTGGEDVTPFLYGERPVNVDGKEVVYFDPNRDLREMQVWYKHLETPKVGICRGAQFLNVMSGGTLWQHVTDHTSNHLMKYVSGFIEAKNKQRQPIWREIEVTSTHHQMMIPSHMGEVIGVAGVSKNKYNQHKSSTFPEPQKYEMDTEIVFYWHTMSLCYQPHPEYVAKTHNCQKVFFQLVNDYLKVS